MSLKRMNDSPCVLSVPGRTRISKVSDPEENSCQPPFDAVILVYGGYVKCMEEGGENDKTNEEGERG